MFVEIQFTSSDPSATEEGNIEKEEQQAAREQVLSLTLEIRSYQQVDRKQHSVKNYSSPQKRNCISRKARKPGKVERHIAQKNQERKKQYFLEGFQTGKRTTQRYFLKVSQTRKRGVSTIIDTRKGSLFVQRLRNLQKRSFKNHSSKKTKYFCRAKASPQKIERSHIST